MKHIIRKAILFSSALVMGLGLSVMTPFYAGVASSDATNYCAGYGGDTQKACVTGYDGKDNKDPDQVCKSYSGDDKTVCVNAWGYAARVDPATKCSSSDQCDLIGKYVNPIINVLAISFGLIATISIIAGAIQYTASEGDPQKSAAAKSRITNTIIAVVAFLLLFAFLEFLIPGGVFNRQL